MCSVQAKGEVLQVRARYGECVRAFLGVHHQHQCKGRVSDSISTTRRGITSIWVMSKMATSTDNLKWFHQHWSSHYHLLETALPMFDVAVFIMQHIERLSISYVSNKVRVDFLRIFLFMSSQKTNFCFWHNTLNQLQVTLCFSWMMRLSVLRSVLSCIIPSWQLHQQQHLWSLGSKLLHWLSIYQIGQSRITDVNSKSCSHLRIWNQNQSSWHPFKSKLSQKVVFWDHWRAGQSGSCGCLSFFRVHSSKFSGGKSPEKSRSDSPSKEDTYCVMFDKTFRYQKYTNWTFSKYSISEAWAIEHLAKSHSKFNGLRAKSHSKFNGLSTSSHMFLHPDLRSETCSFPESDSTIFIGDQDYTLKCTNTNVWLDGDFLEEFAT